MRRVLCALLLVMGAHLASAEALRIAVSRGPVSLPLYVAEAAGLFDKEGVSVKAVDCSSGRDCFRLMAEGSADLATAAELVATLNSFTRPDVVMLASISSSSSQLKLVGRRSAGIAQPASLSGKRIGTVLGSSAQYFLDSWLIFHDINPHEVTLVGLAPDLLANALQRRELDAIAIWEPLASNALAAVGTDAVLLPSPRVYTQHFGLITLRSTVAAREAALLKLLRALLRAERLIADDPARAKAVLMAKLDCSAALAEAHLREHDFRIRLDQSLASTMSSEARWALREHLVSSSSDPDGVGAVVQPSLLRRVSPKAVTLVR